MNTPGRRRGTGVAARARPADRASSPPGCAPRPRRRDVCRSTCGLPSAREPPLAAASLASRRSSPAARRRGRAGGRVGADDDLSGRHHGERRRRRPRPHRAPYRPAPSPRSPTSWISCSPPSSRSSLEGGEGSGVVVAPGGSSRTTTSSQRTAACRSCSRAAARLDSDGRGTDEFTDLALLTVEGEGCRRPVRGGACRAWASSRSRSATRSASRRR